MQKNLLTETFAKGIINYGSKSSNSFRHTF